MTDLNVTAKVSRTLLGLTDLDLNDHSSYVLSGPVAFQGQVSWQRTVTGAPWVDGEVTWERHRSNSTEPLTIYAKGSSQSDLDSKISALTAAFFQDRFTFDIDPFRKRCLLEGLDDIGLTLEKKSEIDDFEKKQKEAQPWLHAAE